MVIAILALLVSILPPSLRQAKALAWAGAATWGAQRCSVATRQPSSHATAFKSWHDGAILAFRASRAIVAACTRPIDDTNQ